MTDHITRLYRIRIAVRLTLTVGVLVSVAANILSADRHPISQAMSAWAPVALLLCVEIISRVPATSRARAWLRMIAAAIIASIAAWVSYWHMVDVAIRYGETSITPYLLPISVDGLIVVASISLVEIGNQLRRHETPTTRTVTEPATVDPVATTAPATPTRPAIAIPADTAARLAATFPASTTPPASAARNGHQPAGNLAQEPLL